MTAEHAPDFITSHPDKVVRSILYVCWIATFNTPEHHMGLSLAQSQVRCMLFACNDGRNAAYRDAIDDDVEQIAELLAAGTYWEWYQARAVDLAESLARLRDRVVTT